MVVSCLIRRYGEKVRIPAYLLGAAIMVTGYFLAKWYLKGNMMVAAAGIPENILQSAAGVAIAVVACPLIRRSLARSRAHSTV